MKQKSAKKAANKVVTKSVRAKAPGKPAGRIETAHLKKLHKALKDAGFNNHALTSIKLKPLAAGAPAGCHMVCTTGPNGIVNCRMVCP